MRDFSNWVLLYIAIGVIFASFGQLLFKMGTNITGELSLSNLLQLLNAYIILGLIFYAIGSVFWIIALSKADLSFVYPFIALTFLIVYACSAIILHEPIHLNRLAGAGIIMIGLFVLFALD